MTLSVPRREIRARRGSTDNTCRKRAAGWEKGKEVVASVGKAGDRILGQVGV